MFPHGIWQGERCFILGGGPTLTAEIAARVRGRGKTIVCNSTARLAPWADALFFHDWPWFRDNRPIVDNWPGKVFTASARARRVRPRCELYFVVPPLIQAKPLSSGHHAVDVAIALGVAEIVLLGFDCRVVEGRSHNHDDYANPKGKCYGETFLPAWAEYPARAEKRGVTVLNATPGSAIEVFPTAELQELL
jgi:hypothetical protein